jgi:hypothetical protein
VQLAAFAFGAAALVGCDADTPTTRAYQIETLDEAIGGPTASGRIGDFVLTNGEIVAVIEGGRRSRLFLDGGGTLIDADLVRPQREYRAGRGLDQLGQIAPVANLFVASALEEPQVRITQSSSGAEVTAAATGGPAQNILIVLGLLVRRDYIERGYDHAELQLYTEYEVRPGERLIRITTTIGHEVPFCPVEPGDGCAATCDDAVYDDDCDCPVPDRCLPADLLAADALPDGEGRGVLDIIFGDLPRPLGSGTCNSATDCEPGQDCVRLTTALGGISNVCRDPTDRDAGILLGDMLLFGANVGLFMPGIGYDSTSDFQRLFGRGVDTLGTPLPFGAVYAVGEDVSYGYAPPAGEVLIPALTEAFSFGAVAATSCAHSDQGCLKGRVVRFERWVSIGDGDTATAQRAIDTARGTPLGEITGAVLAAGSGDPVTSAEVFAFDDPRALPCDADCLARCGELNVSDDELRAWSIEQLLGANRCRTVAPAFVEGVAGLVNAATVDVGARPTREGRYRMWLPDGRYVLAAVDGVRARSHPVPIEVTPGQTTDLSFVLSRHGTLAYSIFDEHAEPSPGRIRVGSCPPVSSCVTDADCSTGLACLDGACACERSRLLPLELGGSFFADGTLAFDITGDGTGELDLPPGTYDVIFSRGPQSTIDQQTVTVVPGRTERISGTVIRAVDRSEWATADFHVHQDPSLDSGVALRDRVNDFLAEDMDFLSSSDHDVLTQFEGTVQQIGARDRIGSQVGVEVSSQELGHFIGWPLRYQEFQDGEPVDGYGAPDWRGLYPEEIFAALRALERDDGPPVVVEVPHPYSYFDFYGVDPVSIEPSDSILSAINPLLGAAQFSGDFDAMEVLNHKSADLLRRPTVGELRFYSAGLDALAAERTSGAIDEATYQRRAYALSTEMTRRAMHRTVEEQQAMLAGEGNDVACLCGSDGDCAAGSICDPVELRCIRGEPAAGDPPADDAMCRRFRGVVDDWFNMLNRGVRRTVVGGSDTHDLYSAEGGTPRTMIRHHGSTPPYLSSHQIAAGVRAGEVVVTTGPMIHFTIEGQPLGATVSGRSEVSLSVRVEKAPWYDVDRVEIYRNGELIHWITACVGARAEPTADPHGHPCIRVGTGDVVAYEETLTDAPGSDAWYVVVAMGLDGRTLAPVYSSRTQARFGTFEVAQKIFDIIPALSGFRTPRFPSLYPTFPFAITNPIWVDPDGNGIEPTWDPPSWCRPGDYGCPG